MKPSNRRGRKLQSLPKVEIHLVKEEIILFSQRNGGIEGFFSHRSCSNLLGEWVHLLEEHCQFHHAAPSDLLWTLASVSPNLKKIETLIHQSGGKILRSFLRERKFKLLLDPNQGKIRFLDPPLSLVGKKSNT